MQLDWMHRGSVKSLDLGDQFLSFPYGAQASPALVFTAVWTVLWHPDAQTQIQRCKHTTHNAAWCVAQLQSYVCLEVSET